VITVTTTLTTFSTLYQPVFFAIVFVFDIESVALFKSECLPITVRFAPP
jgi:hypothetical protein